MPDMHLRQPGFTYSACEPFTKNKERTKKFKETADSRYVYQNELDKARFYNVMAYADFKSLPRRTAADRVLRDKTFNIAKSTKNDGYQRGLSSMVYKVYDETNAGGAVKNEIMQNKEVAEELHKPITKKFEKCKVYSSFKDSIFGADLADMQPLSKFIN